MNTPKVTSGSFVLCLTAVLIAVTSVWQVAAQTTTSSIANQNYATPVAPLEFIEFFAPSNAELKLSPKLLALNGKRVRLVGFMAQMEDAPLGAFYLCPRPVFCDESGGGTADLPAESVRVVVRSAKGKAIPFTPRALEVTGLLEVGNRVEDDGQMSAIRLILDGAEAPPDASKSSAKSSAKNLQH